MDLRKFVRQRGITATGSRYFRAECFLLWALPLSFIVPAVWREAALADRQAAGVHAGRALVGLGGFGLAIVLILASVLSFPGQGTSPRMIELGQLPPIGLVALGGLVAVVLRKACREVRVLAAVSGVAMASWVVWLRAYLLGSEQGLTAWLGMPASGSFAVGVGTAILGIVTAGLTWRSRWAPVRDDARGAVRISGNSGDSQSESFRPGGRVCAGLEPGRMGRRAGGTNLRAVASASSRRGPGGAGRGRGCRCSHDELSRFWTVLPRAQGAADFRPGRVAVVLRAHDAARFAGQPGLPERALVFGLRQAGVYFVP